MYFFWWCDSLFSGMRSVCRSAPLEKSVAQPQLMTPTVVWETLRYKHMQHWKIRLTEEFPFPRCRHLNAWPQGNDRVLCVTGNTPKQKNPKMLKRKWIQSYCMIARLLLPDFCLLFASVRNCRQWLQIESSDSYLGGAKERGECFCFRNEIYTHPKAMGLLIPDVLSRLLSFFLSMRNGQKSTEPWNSTTERR